MEQMQVLGLAALFAGMAKTAILFFSQTENKLTSAFALVCISMILQNTFEFLVAFTYFGNPSLAELFLHAEMLSIIFLAFCVLVFALTVAECRYIKPLSTLFGLWALLCGGLLLTGQLVLGYEQAGYSVISIAAPYYSVLNAFAFVALNVVLIILGHAIYSKGSEVKRRCQQVLIALSPIYLLVLAVQLTRLLGFDSSTAVLMPLATTFFIGMMVLYQSDRIVIFKIKWKVIWKLATQMRDVKMSEWVGQVEELLVKESMRVSGNNQSEAAKLIKSNQSTVGRKFKKYGEGVENSAN